MKKFVLLLLLSTNLYADPGCPKSDFDMNYLPVSEVNNLYCYQQYVLVYDLEKKSAVFVGEHLGKGEKFWKIRKNSFAINKQIPEGSRTTLKDYIEPNYDRGHLASSGNMTSASSEIESFLMSNMVPQTKELNRGMWKKLEDYLRNLSETKELIIITGPIFTDPIHYIGNKVPVPTSTFKYIYNLTDNTQYGYIMPNRNEFSSSVLDYYKTDKNRIEELARIKMSK